MTQRVAGAPILALLAACGQDIRFTPDPKPPVAEPPGKDPDAVGEPPDWQTCVEGWRGRYTNLPADHRFVTPRRADPPMGTDPTALNLWDEVAFEQFDPSLDFGSNWWPVDEGLEEDPAYFAVYWHAWVRAWSGTTLSFVLGSSDDAWVAVDGVEVAAQPGIHELERVRYDAPLGAGQYPIEVRFAHRASPSAGLSFRVVGGDVSLCYPEFAPPEAE